MSNYGFINHSFNQVATQPYGYQITGNNLPNYTHSLRDSSHCFSSLNTPYPPLTAQDSTPPYNVCIEPFVVSTKTSKKFSPKTVARFHANIECVWLKEPYFDPSSLSIPEEVLVTLSPANKV